MWMDSLYTVQVRTEDGAMENRQLGQCIGNRIGHLDGSATAQFAPKVEYSRQQPNARCERRQHWPFAQNPPISNP
jgi:hypothetical protein